MMVKDEYRCQVCGDMKSCLVMTEFTLPFGICMECYVTMKSAVADEKETHPDDICQMCDTRKDVFNFKKEGLLPIISKLKICPDCFKMLEEFVENRIKYM
jgi:hypothetical protein